MSITAANKLFAEGQLEQAKDAYRTVLKTWQRDRGYPKSLYAYSLEQCKALDETGVSRFVDKNIVITSCNSKYFNSLLLMVASLLENSGSCVDEVCIFDFGLEPRQRKFLENLQRVRLFTFNKEDVKHLQVSFDWMDPKTYAFKVYAFHCFKKHSAFKNAGRLNCLWVDSGIEVKRSLAEVFEILDKEEAFFIDHDDTADYYDNPSNLLVNTLSPRMFTELPGLKAPTADQLMKQYVKASFFGLKVGGKYQALINEHLRICTSSGVLKEPRQVTSAADKKYWNDKTKIGKVLAERGIKNSGEYLHGRHEQTVWSYLVALSDIKIRNSSYFNYTTAPGSGTANKSNWTTVMRPRLVAKYELLADGMRQFLLEHEPAAIGRVLQLHGDELVDEYLKVSQKVYFDEPIFDAPGFPTSANAKPSIVHLHRGSSARMDQFKYAGALNKHRAQLREEIFVLMGNGPSLGDVDFETLKPHDTFGLNAAYRAYKRINFFPKYFGCFDALVCKHHSPEFKKLILDSPISKFFFINFDDQGKPIFPENEIQQSPKFEKIDFRYRRPEEKARDDILASSFAPFPDMLTSGSNSIQCAILMGYRKIILLGCDANYVELVDGAKQKKNPNKLIMEKTPESNPNYWFADYQQQGDEFNKPNLTGCQLPAWDRLASTLDTLELGVEIINCSPISRIDCFKKMPLNDAFQYLGQQRAAEIVPFRTQGT